MTAPRRTLVIVPTFDEAATIAATLEGLRVRVPDADVLVVDDGSPDGTADLVDQIAADEASTGAARALSVLRRPGKLGLGTAYVQGFRWALDRGYDTVVEMDADGSHRAEDLPRLLARASQAELVIGSRWVPGGRVLHWPKHREVLSRLGNLYTRVLLGLGVRDATAGFRVYDAALLRRIPLDEIASHGYGFQVDMTWRARRAGARIIEIPIVFVERTAGVSKMSNAIIVEAMTLVTRWGVAHRVGQLLRLVRHRAT
ncbi:MAG: polyprenol monophosphomannose synthase [Micrococcales bacterium]|nr:polyprenol monophosphomannose synthase [Micrococcales bacterium]